MLSEKKNQDYLIQACAKTNGLYLPTPPRIDKGVVEYFLNAYLVNTEARRHFRLPYITVSYTHLTLPTKRIV